MSCHCRCWPAAWMHHAGAGCLCVSFVFITGLHRQRQVGFTWNHCVYSNCLWAKRKEDALYNRFSICKMVHARGEQFENPETRVFKRSQNKLGGNFEFSITYLHLLFFGGGTILKWSLSSSLKIITGLFFICMPRTYCMCIAGYY